MTRLKAFVRRHPIGVRVAVTLIGLVLTGIVVGLVLFFLLYAAGLVWLAWLAWLAASGL
jgi:putative effector of murein hydrolase LrgA (UPF0299 family)